MFVKNWEQTEYKKKSAFLEDLATLRNQDKEYLGNKIRSCFEFRKKLVISVLKKAKFRDPLNSLATIVEIFERELNTNPKCNKTLLPIMRYFTKAMILGKKKISTFKISLVLRAEGESGKSYLLKQMQRVLLAVDDNYNIFEEKMCNLESLNYADLVVADECFKPVSYAEEGRLKGLNKLRRLSPLYNFAVLEMNWRVYRTAGVSRPKGNFVVLCSAEAPSGPPSFDEYRRAFGERKSEEDYKGLLKQIDRRFVYAIVLPQFREWGEIFFGRINRYNKNSFYQTWINKVCMDPDPEEKFNAKLEINGLLDRAAVSSVSEVFGQMYTGVSGEEKNDIFELCEDFFYICLMKWSTDEVERITSKESFSVDDVHIDDDDERIYEDSNYQEEITENELIVHTHNL